MSLNPKQKAIHEQALRVAKNFRHSEAEMISALQLVENEQIYLALGVNSLFEYARSILLLSESNSYLFMSIAKKSRQIPELKTEIENGNLSPSKAGRIISVITPENKNTWIEKAETLPKDELEREVRKEKPEEVRESVRIVSEHRFSLRLGVSQEFLNKLKRAQEIVSNQKRKAASAEIALEEALESFLEHHDPVRKAERSAERAATRSKAAMTIEENAAKDLDNSLCPGKVKTDEAHPAVGGIVHREKREPIPAAVKHAVFLRDHGKCCYAVNNHRCGSAYFTEIHHRVEVSCGGLNSIENLVTLCSQHHAYWHSQKSRRIA